MVELAVEGNSAVVFGDDTVDDGEAKAGAVGLRAEEGVKETGQVSLRDAHSGIGDRDREGRILLRRADG